MFKLYENRFFGSEDDLVKAFISKYKNRDISFGDKFIRGEYFEQIRIPEVRRVSDLVVKCEKSRLINIEFKLSDYACVMRQAKDHLRWADYSYICAPINSLEIFPQSFVLELIERGIGLIVGNEKTFVEVFRAKHNTYKKGKVKEFRLNVLNRINKKAKDAKGNPSLFD